MIVIQPSLSEESVIYSYLLLADDDNPSALFITLMCVYFIMFIYIILMTSFRFLNTNGNYSYIDLSTNYCKNI